MLIDCLDQELLSQLVGQSTSCSRYARNKLQHCGRCVPCQVRRAAFHKWNVADPTSYLYSDLSLSDHQHRHYDDVKSVLFAIKKIAASDIETWSFGALNHAQLGDTQPYMEVAERGIQELKNFHAQMGTL